MEGAHPTVFPAGSFLQSRMSNTFIKAENQQTNTHIDPRLLLPPRHLSLEGRAESTEVCGWTGAQKSGKCIMWDPRGEARGCQQLWLWASTHHQSSAWQSLLPSSPHLMQRADRSNYESQVAAAKPCGEGKERGEKGYGGPGKLHLPTALTTPFCAQAFS